MNVHVRGSKSELGAPSIRRTCKEFLNPGLLFEHVCSLVIQFNCSYNSKKLARIPVVVFASFEGGSSILSNSCVAQISNYLSICPIVSFKEEEEHEAGTASVLA